MGSTTLSPSMKLMILLVLLTSTVSLALDMSIISYDKTHPDKSTQRTDKEVMNMYEEWLVKHGKSYNALGEKDKRFEIFKDNLKFIDEHNSQNLSYKLGLNRFADLTNEEYRTKFLGTRMDPNRRMKKVGSRSNRYAPRVGDKLPESVDWRKEGAVVGVKDQASCGKQTLSILSQFHLS
jgi:C1A family cysteine protease